ncbi:MAG: class I SAM-dependent methyltransferase [Actinomycetota bacterium]
MTAEPDRLFSDAELAQIYDDLEGDRLDLDHYEALVTELEATSVLDVGCGTGELSLRLARSGLEVTGVDPALASLRVAQAKPGAHRVRWIHGTAPSLPPLALDLAVMTGNVAQVFLTDDDWAATVAAVRAALVPAGSFVFETRDPRDQAWERWHAEPSRTIDTRIGPVSRSIEVTDVALPLVSFRVDYDVAASGQQLSSTSTLRFRSEAEVRASLAAAGFAVDEIRDAPDRPGREFVFIARAR